LYASIVALAGGKLIKRDLNLKEASKLAAILLEALIPSHMLPIFYNSLVDDTLVGCGGILLSIHGTRLRIRR
jgi:hypothetical protein